MGDNRERFERELHQLCRYKFKRLLVVGSEAEILAGQYATPLWDEKEPAIGFEPMTY